MEQPKGKIGYKPYFKRAGDGSKRSTIDSGAGMPRAHIDQGIPQAGSHFAEGT